MLDNVLDGFRSSQDAADVYGVVLNPESETVDLAATEIRRTELEAH